MRKELTKGPEISTTLTQYFSSSGETKMYRRVSNETKVDCSENYRRKTDETAPDGFLSLLLLFVGI